MRDIWVPKNLVTNPMGLNKCWVPRNACLACRIERGALSTWLKDLEIMMDSIDHVKGKFI
jgi:hypothetical protein